MRKLSALLTDPVTYQLHLGDQDILLNDFLDKSLTLVFQGEIYCIQCGRKTAKSFQQGHCFPCMKRINECHNCMIHPERCLVEEGNCPRDDWAHRQCHAPHFIYLANSSGLKVGVTRDINVPARWIDQGASAALAIIKAPNRRQAGLVEVAFKKYVNDKTNWRVMLKNEITDMDLGAEKMRLMSLLPDYGSQVCEVLEHEKVVRIHYPVLSYPSVIKSLSFDETPNISGVLQGIKGQYLLLDTGVLNIRKFSGYKVVFLG